jgi:hypothetical protein
MMNIVRAAMVLGFLAACGPSLASDLYRCDSADRRTLYQATQCEIGVKQRALDPQNAKRERIKLEQERQRKQQKSEETAVTGNS